MMDGKPPLVYSIQEGADLLRISHDKMGRMCNSGEIRSIKIGSRRLITAYAISEFLADKENNRTGSLRSPSASR